MADNMTLGKQEKELAVPKSLHHDLKAGGRAKALSWNSLRVET